MATIQPQSRLPDWCAEFKRLEGAYSPNTMRAYLSDVEAFVAWCLERDLAPFPAEVETVCEFIRDEATRKVTSTVRRRLCAIRKAHKLLRLTDPTRDEDIDIALRRISRAKRSRPKQAKGLTRDYLDSFLAVQPETPTGWRNRAMLSLGYDLLARRSELVALLDEDVEFRPDGTLSVLIRRSKVDPAGFGRLAFTSRRSAELLRQWLDWRGSTVSYLFCPIYHDVAIDRGLSPTTVRRVIKEAARMAGLNVGLVGDFSGHSMRVGAAQDLLRAGHDTAAIMRAGGWKSINVLSRYLENAEHNVWN